MTTAVAAPVRHDPRLSFDRIGERQLCLGVIAAVLLIQLELVFNRPINWDEFYHLSLVHSLQQGRLSEVLQVLHVRLLSWVAVLPFDEIGQIIAARLVMFCFELFTLSAIYGLARRLAEARFAVFAPLIYVTAGFVFQHGFSFRADPLVTAMLMGALWLLAAAKPSAWAFAGISILLALSGFATIKAVLFLPAFAAIGWERLRGADLPGWLAVRLAITLIVSAALFAGLVWWATTAAAPSATGSAGSTVKASQTMLLAEGLFPRWQYLLQAIGMAPILFMAVGAAAVSIRSSRTAGMARLTIAGLLLPLACVAFYRNAFPYFYAFILAPVAVGMVPGIAWLLGRYGAKALCFACLVSAVIVSALAPRAIMDDQRSVLREVHRIFPQPVAYFDFCGMVAAFPKANVFMSTWGQTRYRSGEVPGYADALRRQDVPLLLANNDVLQRNQSPQGPAWELLAPDAALLRAQYVHQWGPIWLAGHSFAPGSPAQDFALPASGTYTLEGSAAEIDGRRLEPGETITLTRGVHRFVPTATAPSVLRWGDKPFAAPASEPAGIPFKDF